MTVPNSAKQAIKWLQQQRDALRVERDQERIRADNAVELLVSIHSLLRQASKDLIEVVPPPIAEYIADAHNDAVQKIRAAIR